MLVEDLMTTDIVTCDYDTSLRTAGVQMLENGVGSVVVVREGNPVGIVTETDSLQAGIATDQPFSEIPVKKVLSHPLITVTEDITIRKAVNRMKENDIKKFPVVDGMELKGIITLTDIATHHEDVIEEMHKREQQRERWEATKADIDEF